MSTELDSGQCVFSLDEMKVSVEPHATVAVLTQTHAVSDRQLYRAVQCTYKARARERASKDHPPTHLPCVH